MPLRVSNKDWNNPPFRDSVLRFAEHFQMDIEVELPKKEFLPYNVQIWVGDDIAEAKDFKYVKDARKWISEKLHEDKYHNAYADLKKYNIREDDFDWWFYILRNGSIEDVIDPEEELANEGRVAH